jgi:hypothetical protein
MKELIIFTFCYGDFWGDFMREVAWILGGVLLVILLWKLFNLSPLHTVYEEGYTTWDLLDDLTDFYQGVRRWKGARVIFREGDDGDDDVLPYGGLKIRWEKGALEFRVQRVEVMYGGDCAYHDVWQGSLEKLKVMLRGRLMLLPSFIKGFGLKKIK